MSSIDVIDYMEEIETHNHEWKLDTIPEELFLHICSFLSSKFIINVLSKVCTKFDYILSDDAIWKIRLSKRFSRKYPVTKYTDFFWKKACIAVEEQCRLWSNDASNMKKCHIAMAHSAAVDVVRLLENSTFCASGSRDRDIRLWDIGTVTSQLEDTGPTTCHSNITSAHSGWIWCMEYSAFHHTLYTGSWDSSIKSWDVNTFGSSREKAMYPVTSPALCLAFSDNVLACGRFDKVLALYDPRANSLPIERHTFHRKPILCLAACKKFIISGSEDHSLIIYNRVSGTIQNKIQLDGYPLSLCYNEHSLWVGDNQGFLHLIDPFEEKFELVQSFPSGHSSRVTGIHYSLGSLITCSADKTIRVLEPCTDPKTITVIASKCEVAGISMHMDTVVSANSDDSITVFTPNNAD